MTDTITESFCERCGTRFSFDQTAKPRRGGIGRVRVLGRGLKNYVANDGMPMAEAMAAARDDEARAGTTKQLDAFHKTFNFCMACRQYSCPNCWNETAGECLTCAPDLTREVLPAPFPDLPAAGPVAAGNGHEDADAMAWPRVDLERGGPGLEAEAPAGSAAFGAEDATEEPTVLARLDAFVAAPAHPVEELTPDELAEIEHALAGARPADRDAEPVAVVDDAAATEVVAAAPAAEALAADEAPAAAATDAAAPADATEADARSAALMAAAGAAGVAAAAAAITEAEPADEPATSTDQVDVARGQTRSLLSRFRPGRPAGAAPEPKAPPADRVPSEALAAAAGLAAAEPEPAPVVEPEAVAAAEPEPAPVVEPEPVAAAEPEPAPVVEPEAVAAAEPEVVAAAEPEPAPVVEPEAVAAAEPEPVAAAEPEPAPVVEPEPVAAAEPEPAPVVEPEAVAAAEPEPVAAAEPEPVAAEPAPRRDTIEQPTWRVVAPEAIPTEPTTTPGAPAWPTQPTATARPDHVPGPGASPWASRLATARPETSGVWAASTQQVLGAAPAGATGPHGTPAVQSCISCGLSLSANARFCRRCGTRQS